MHIRHIYCILFFSGPQWQEMMDSTSFAQKIVHIGVVHKGYRQVLQICNCHAI
jgi:hypothetical protein